MQCWDLAQRLGGQLRAIPGGVVGWDLTAALALGSALGIDARIVAEIIPEIEAVAIREINNQLRNSEDG